MTPVVFVHVYYEDVWSEISQTLADSFSSPFSLIVTCRPDLPTPAPPVTPQLSYFRCITVENRGRDIWPFLYALEQCGIDFEVGLKLHTKRSTHRADGDQWRRYMIDSLVTSFDGVIIPDLIARETRIGLVAPRAHLLPLQGRMATNGPLMAQMLKALDIRVSVSLLEHGRYSAGSMFWFRREALSVFRTDRLAHLLDSEKGQLDGTVAHAAERLFAEVVKARGHAVIPVEAVPRIAALMTEKKSLTCEEIAEIAENFSVDENPFSLGVPKAWRQYPTLVRFGHYLYLRFPNAVRRMLKLLKPRYPS